MTVPNTRHSHPHASGTAMCLPASMMCRGPLIHAGCIITSSQLLVLGILAVPDIVRHGFFKAFLHTDRPRPYPKLPRTLEQSALGGERLCNVLQADVNFAPIFKAHYFEVQQLLMSHAGLWRSVSTTDQDRPPPLF